jgi:uncharacterized protein YqgC (DUF456 family)
VEVATVLLWLLVAVLVVVGLAGAVIPVIPGVPLVFAGLWLGAWIDHYAKVSGLTVTVLGVLALVALALDAVASLLGAKRAGASRQAMAGAAIGAIVGLFVFPPFGLLLGPFVGAVAGELAARGNLDQAARVGVATWIGLLLGAVVKLATSIAMLAIFTFAYLV